MICFGCATGKEYFPPLTQVMLGDSVGLVRCTYICRWADWALVFSGYSVNGFMVTVPLFLCGRRTTQTCVSTHRQPSYHRSVTSHQQLTYFYNTNKRMFIVSADACCNPRSSRVYYLLCFMCQWVQL